MSGSKSPERSVTQARIIEAAAQLFARQGFKATTTKEIAELAGVNEATLYRHFACKPDMFLAAIRSRLIKLRMSHELQTALLQTATPRATVQKMMRFLAENFINQPDLIRLLHVATFEVPESTTIIREHVGPIFDAITGYYCRCAAKGEIWDVDPSLATAGMIAVAAANEFLPTWFSKHPVPDLDTQARIDTLAQLWLRAVIARDAGAGAFAVPH